ncbi:F-box protein [Senna tora]|uniref:F-box protein n=1 Tax=Senna tora TaxID=362788 RepID=A0A834TBT5_9FABA|nr:F-box protein [Senna tora]
MSIQLMKKEVSLMDLPESTLDYILERLSPLDLCNISEVCTSLLGRSRSNRLWEKHIQLKWGRLLGDVAYKEWEGHVKRIMNNEASLLPPNANGLLGTLRGVWPLLCLASYLENPRDLTFLLMSNCSNLALYISLQSGRFWFPSQRRRLYDALLSYDCVSNTFRARYPTLGWRGIEENIKWDRIGTMVLLVTWNHVRRMRIIVLVCIVLFHRSESLKAVVLNRKVNGVQIIGFWKFGGIRKLDNQEDIQRWNIIDP